MYRHMGLNSLVPCKDVSTDSAGNGVREFDHFEFRTDFAWLTVGLWAMPEWDRTLRVNHGRAFGLKYRTAMWAFIGMDNFTVRRGVFMSCQSMQGHLYPGANIRT